MRRHAFFIGLFVFVAAARFAILFASQTHVHSDEAIIGLMGKHILEGRHFPFYMYGQPYNAGAAWEAYLASVAFALFGVGVVPLKGCIVLLSLLCLFLFYRMGCALYDRRTAVFATVVFALTPSLLKWHFQVRGYSWYFLSIPVLTLLFASIESTSVSKRRTLLLFGLASGLSIWCLELAVPLVAALWLLLILRRRISLSSAPAGLIGFLLGYAPVIVFNLTYRFSNWRYVVIERPGVDFRLSFSFPIGGEFFWMKCRSSSDRTRFFGTMARNRQSATFSTQSPCSLSAWGSGLSLNHLEKFCARCAVI